MHKYLFCSLAFAAMWFAPVVAEERTDAGLDYGYIQVGIATLDLDLRSDSDIGIGLVPSASLDVGRGLYVHGQFESFVHSSNLGTLEEVWNAGLGYRFRAWDRTDVFVEGSYAVANRGMLKSEGLRADAGLRHRFNERLDGRVFGGVLDDTTVFGGDLHYRFRPNLGISLSAESYETDLNIYRLNLRFGF